MHLIGTDLWGRPTIYSCFQLASNRDPADNRQHMITVFELAVKLMSREPGVERWNWIMDFHGFNLMDCDPRIAKVLGSPRARAARGRP